MKLYSHSITLLLSSLIFSATGFAKGIAGPYFGQTPPGETPEVFAPGIVSKEHRDWTGRFTPDMTEYYFTRNNREARTSTQLMFKLIDGKWHEKELAAGVGGAVSADGMKMYSGRTYRDRIGDQWSEPKSIGKAFQSIPIMVISVSDKGMYVFDEREVKGTIRYSRLIDGKREAPKAFGKQINSGKWTAHPFVAPDESYIIWDSEREGGYGKTDLYVSFQLENGIWSDAINLGDKINTPGPDTGAVVSPDGKYLFFNRKFSEDDSDIMWVDAKVIDDLRPKR
ncbi:PD40 domain-containing protein [Pseudoalteromonas luteoviolacea]|uniref:WD40-like Beta Propeller Repeat n=1 Tax=Pseudoalteromonas luteoviolacea H33 TaxID=1365251 RepID=A0A167AI42_9GAMM|nr:PD40 domain-containing protein [Pseudoalteromonas luteoviolacea]KZN45411.1 hypothetical protein N476_05175 [Pseudoalteromonas luteoviolacea H33]KZN70725.1 hypothetical protein N477_04865 [Pseudoalteromonas luteoviolacea H33-S]